MKKVSIIVQEKDAAGVVAALGFLGAVHVKHQQTPQGENITGLNNALALVNEAIGITSQPAFAQHSKPGEGADVPDWEFIARHVIDSYKRLDQLKEYSHLLVQRISQWQEWGDFNPSAVNELAEKGIFVRFFQIPLKDLGTLPDALVVKKISSEKGIANCVVVSTKKVELLFRELALPKTGLEEMRARLAKDMAVMEHIRADIKKHAYYNTALMQAKEKLEKELEFHEAAMGMGKAGELSYLGGYIPFDRVSELMDEARRGKWGVLIAEPSGEDAVPTLLRNPRWVEIISPLFKFLEIIPGYSELDISPVFLCFLSLFFGMIIGDAGYGSIYFLFTLWMQRKFSAKIKDKRVFFLFYAFSACAIFWGILTGTFFGQEWYFKSGHRALLPVLNDTKFLQAFCFFLGALHLTIGHAWQALRKLPSLTALSDAGWMCVLWAAFFLAKTLILDDPFPHFAKWLIIGGITLVVFCSSPQKNILKMIGQGLGTLALSLVNNFTDVVSYVRLFAVGLAGVAISDTVNMLAAGMGDGNLIAQGLIVFLGHTVNMLLGPMSVLVHGIRLNVLEFSGHAGLSWSGVAYKPLKN